MMKAIVTGYLLVVSVLLSPVYAFTSERIEQERNLELSRRDEAAIRQRHDLSGKLEGQRKAYRDALREFETKGDIRSYQDFVSNAIASHPEKSYTRFSHARQFLEAYRRVLTKLVRDGTSTEEDFRFLLLLREEVLSYRRGYDLLGLRQQTEMAQAIEASTITNEITKGIPPAIRPEWVRHLVGFLEHMEALQQQYDELAAAYETHTNSRKLPHSAKLHLKLKFQAKQDRARRQKGVRLGDEEYKADVLLPIIDSNILWRIHEMDDFLRNRYAKELEPQIIRSITSFYRENPESLFELYEIVDASSLSDAIIAAIWHDVRPGAAKFEEEPKRHTPSSSEPVSRKPESIHSKLSLDTPKRTDEETLEELRQQMRKQTQEIRSGGRDALDEE